MKYFTLVIVGLLVTFLNNVSGEEEECPLKKAIRASIDACKDKLSQESIDLLEKDENADNEDIRCFKACILNHSGMMDTGKMQIDKLKAILNEAVEKAEENKDKVKEMAEAVIEAAESCAEKAEKSENECEKAHEFIECLKEYDSEE